MQISPMRRAFAVVTVSLIALLAGCAGNNKLSRGPVFFPPAPNLPRLQYLTGISDSSDVEGRPRDFSLFSYGKASPRQIVPMIKPSGIASAGGKLYVSDLSGQLFILDLPGKSMQQLRGNLGAGKLQKPVGVAVSPGGVLFVSDVGRKEVLIYNNKGEYLKSVGRELDMTPTDVAVDASSLYVLDTRKGVIHLFDPESGAFLRDIGRLGDHRQSLSLPTKMSLDKEGVIRVSNAGRGDITSYDRDGHFLGAFGMLGDGLGQFSRPKGLTVDANGYIYVVDAGFQNVQVFNDGGRLLTYFGSGRLPAGGMNLPCDISISSADLPYYQGLAGKDFELSQVVFVANQFGHPKISLYGYGKMRGVDYDAVYQRTAKEREQKARAELKERNKQ